MRLVSWSMVVVLSACGTSVSALELQAINSFRQCMQEGGLQARSVTFEIEGRQLVSFNSVYAGQGTIEADNVHNECIREVIDELELEAQHP